MLSETEHVCFVPKADMKSCRPQREKKSGSRGNVSGGFELKPVGPQDSGRVFAMAGVTILGTIWAQWVRELCQEPIPSL